MEMLDCGHEPSEHSDCTTGYGTDAQGKRHCYECCANNDIDAMIRDGRATLYLTGGIGVTSDGKREVSAKKYPGTISNWPGSLKFNLFHIRLGYHNIVRWRYDVWFNGPDGFKWHGVTYGDNTQLCHCKRTKEKSF